LGPHARYATGTTATHTRNPKTDCHGMGYSAHLSAMSWDGERGGEA
jgi:hypothetical protein